MTRRRTNSPSNICTTGYIPRSLTMLPSLDSFPAARTALDAVGTAVPAVTAAPMTPLPSPSLLQFRRRHVCGGTGPPALKRRKWCNPNAEAVDVVTPSSSSSSSSSSPLPFSPAFSSFRPIPAAKTSLPLLNIIDHDDDDDEDNDEALQDCTAQNNNGRNTGVLIQCPVPRISLRRRTRSNRYFSSVQEYYLNEFEEASPPPQPQPPSPCDHADVTNELGRLPISPSARQELSPARRRRRRVMDATASSFSPSFPALAPPSYEDAIETDDDSPLSEKRMDHEEDSVASTTATMMPETRLRSSKDRTIATAPTLQATRSRTRSDDTPGRRYPSTTPTPTTQIHKTLRRSISLNVSLSFLNRTAPASSSSLATCVDDSFDGDEEDVVDPALVPLPLPSSSSHQSFGSSLLAPLMMQRPSSLLQLSKSFSSSLSLDHLLASTTPGTSSSTATIQGGRGSSPTSWSEGGPDHPPPKPRGRSSPFDYLATAMRFPDVAIGLSI